MKMVDLKEDSESIEEMEMETPAEPEYPYGLCLHIDGDELDKLSINKMPEIGQEFNMMAIAKVTGVRQAAGENMPESRCVDLQIVEMGVEIKAKTKADVMYPRE